MRIAKFMTMLVAVFILIPATVWALDYRLGAEVRNRFCSEENFWDEATGQFSRNDRYNVFNVVPDLFVSQGKAVAGYLKADMEWVHYVEPAQENALDVFVTNAYLSLSASKTIFSIGLMPVQYGNGLILADDGPALTLDHQGPYNTYLGLSCARVLSSSPMAGVTLGYRPGFLEKLEFFGIWFQDEDDGFAQLANHSQWFDGLTSNGNIGWIGVGADLFIGGLFFSGTAMLEKGDLNLSNAIRTASIDLTGYLIDVNLDYTPADWITTGAFCFLAEGDTQFRDRELGVFLAPRPDNPHAGIFFNPEFFHQDPEQENSLYPGGMTLAGVIAPGLRIDIRLLEALSMEVKAAAFFPEKRPSPDRDWYGWEADLLFTYRWNKTKSIFLEGDLFNQGNYFRMPDGGRPKAAGRIMAGFRLVFQSGLKPFPI